MTGLYNVLDKLRKAEPLTAKDKLIHTQGLVSVLKSLHDDIDAAVLQAYGWADLQGALADWTQPDARAAAVETLLERLVALNARRAAEEASGLVRWLRPDFQQRGTATQQRMDVDTDDDQAPEAKAPAPTVAKRPWPTGLPEQIKAVAEVLAASPRAGPGRPGTTFHRTRPLARPAAHHRRHAGSAGPCAPGGCRGSAAGPLAIGLMPAGRLGP